MERRWPDVVFSGEADPAVLSRAVRRMTLRRLAQGVYTGDVVADPADVVRRNLWRIVGHELPGAVIVDRSARSGGPVDGLLIVDHPRSRPLTLPGLTVSPRRGPGPVAVTWKCLMSFGLHLLAASSSTISTDPEEQTVEL